MLNTLIVTESPEVFADSGLQVMTFADYLADFPKRNEPKTRIINLCDTQGYLSEGYYCSLLAQARQHSVLPSVSTLNDLRNDALHGEKRLAVSATLLPQPDKRTHQSIFVMFGEAEVPAYKKLARFVFERYRYPLLKIDIYAGEDGQPDTFAAGIAYVKCEAVLFSSLSEAQQQQCVSLLKTKMQQQWRETKRTKPARWDMAILVNPGEAFPPSDERAIKKFVKAAEKQGFQAEVVSQLSVNELAQYDALFIRETTAIDHHTYRIARAAEREGLVVIDDTQSILRCCNKVFLQDAFEYQHVPAPKAQLVSSGSEESCQALIEKFGFPMVLKMPESSFSRGVHKVSFPAELSEMLLSMLQESALVLVQEYIPTDFDWRIGVLGGKPIYACKYFMARNHWQIYNHSGDRCQSGGFVTLPTFEVPKPVLNAAVKAASVVGHGLYGVDIKQCGNKVYVIEVNDNPSIDAGVEDKYLGDELYNLIIREFSSRLEMRGR